MDRPRESQTDNSKSVSNKTRVHLLDDLLKEKFPEARILSFADNSNWLGNSPVKTTEEIGKSLMEEIKAKRSRPVVNTIPSTSTLLIFYQHLPIIFIGHSMGGIIIKQV